jgi:hypothetical protein
MPATRCAPYVDSSACFAYLPVGEARRAAKGALPEQFARTGTDRGTRAT